KHERPAAKHLRAKDENVMEIDEADVAELVDARDLKSLDGNVVWVRVPPPAPRFALWASRGTATSVQEVRRSPGFSESENGPSRTIPTRVQAAAPGPEGRRRAPRPRATPRSAFLLSLR